MIELSVNGRTHKVDAPPDMPLLWVLRDIMGFTGTKYGCGVAQCGACTVHLDGQPTRACALPAGDIGAAKITTIEGLTGPAADAVQNAWVEHEVAQCGYCQSGQVMAAAALLASDPAPADDAIDAAMTGNLCRCATYFRIRAAIKSAGKSLAKHAA